MDANAAEAIIEEQARTIEKLRAENEETNLSWGHTSEMLGATLSRAEAAEARLAEAVAKMEGALAVWDRNTCLHEDTTRGGTIWTICQSCGSKWADDEGGFEPYKDPAEIAAARTFLQSLGKEG